ATFVALYAAQALLPELAGQFRLSPATASLAVSVATGALAIGVIPLTVLSEAIGRTPVLTGSLFVSSALGLLAAASPSFPVLLVLRASQGLAMAGVPAVAMSYLAEELHRGALGAAMGLYIAGNSIGGMAGRLIAALVDGLAGWRWSLAVVGALALACSVVFRLCVLPSAHFRPRPPKLSALAGSIGRAGADGPLLRLYAVGFLLMACFVTVYNYVGFRLLGPDFRLSTTVVGLVFVVYLAGSCSAASVGRLVDWLGRRRMLLLSAVFTVGGLALLLSPNLGLVILGLVVVTAGFFAAHSVASGWVGARSAALGVQGSALYLFCYYLGSSVGGSLGGIWYGLAGWSAVIAYTVLLIALAALAAPRQSTTDR
ncbi:MAG TPA: MFS transporter, partial [Pseudonocardiaceae bacterium]|nr:MFS transporter [Pseudonocardiaceae bacterium]